LILLADNSEQLRDWVLASDEEWQQMEARWPGPVTFLVAVSSKVPVWIKGEHNKVAIRVSGHPLARKLACLAGMPIVSTSANRSGVAAHRNPEPLEAEMGDELDGIVHGECNISDRPSTIIDLASQTIIRS
jgi:L-threonylcarbamoyladenylate synthase